LGEKQTSELLSHEKPFAMDQQYSAIRKRPYSYRFVDQNKDIRDVKARGIQNGIIYGISGDGIDVYAVPDMQRFRFRKK
jgi:hypothetical protein